jgi:hypothetical protein
MSPVCLARFAFAPRASDELREDFAPAPALSLRLEGVSVLTSSMRKINSPTLTLPAAPENDWRFSYQFANQKSAFLVRLVLGGSVLGVVIVVANVAW